MSPRRLSFGIAVLVLSSPPLGACAATGTPLADHRDEGGERTDPIIGGKETDGSLSVVLLKTEDGERGSWCSGTVIARRLVLTAAHCVAEARPDRARLRVMFGSDESESEPPDYVQVTEWHMDPQYKAMDDIIAGHDAAVLVLESDALSPAIPINRRELTERKVGSRVHVVGFGDDDGEASTGSGLKRHVYTDLHSLERGVMNIGKPGQTTCTGDSGGPAFMKIGGRKVVAGIHSYVRTGCVTYGSAARVDLSAAWIDPYIEEHGGE
jgi:secreted trypsin-like serine protease